MRLLFAVPFSPSRDAVHGGRVVAQLLDRLADRHEVSVVHLERAGAPPFDDDIRARCEVVRAVQVDAPPARVAWRRRARTLAAPLTALPAPVMELRDARLARACVELAERLRPDVVQIEHDELAYVGRALAAAGAPGVRIMTCHEPGILASSDQVAMTRGRQRLAHRLDSLGWARYWARNLPAFELIVTLTEGDRAVIERHVTGPRYETIGLGIDLPAVALDPAGGPEPTVLFVGGYRHPPNADAARRLLRAIMPGVRRELPGARLGIVGADPGRDLISSAGPLDTVTGTVPSVTPFMDAAHVIALPIRMGGGMRVKLLEALAAGKAVVASPLAAAGLAIVSGEHALIAESDAEFEEAILTLLRDEPLRVRIAGNARRWAAENLSWDGRVARYEALYRSVLRSSLR